MQRRAVLRLVPAIGVTGLAGCLGFGNTGTGRDGYGDWFADVGNYDGAVDRTGHGEVTVRVGATGNGGHFAFAPAAITVSSDTTVVWRWTGEGGRHNVVSKTGAFGSEYANSAGHAFDHEFADAGVYPYYCEPHRSLGMKGGVRVTQ